jgi:hypothetical protein
MASGANITVTGGFGMQQVVAGTDLVLPADFNNARSNVARLLGTANAVTLGTFTASNTYGYGQSVTIPTAASTGNTITVTGTAGAFRDLQDNVQALGVFLGITLRAGVGTDVTTSTTITAATWNNLMLDVKDCFDNRFSPASRTLSSPASVTRSTSWTNTLTQVTTWTFSTAAACREFFNGGGRVGVSASRTGGAATTQNTEWSNTLTAVGDVFLTHDTTVATGASPGTVSTIGFYELTTSDQQLLQKFTAASPYTSDNIRVVAKINSTTSPTVVTITTTLTDAGDNSIDESVDGTLTINGRLAMPVVTGTGFTFATPTHSVGAISGS